MIGSTEARDSRKASRSLEILSIQNVSRRRINFRNQRFRHRIELSAISRRGRRSRKRPSVKLSRRRKKFRGSTFPIVRTRRHEANSTLDDYGGNEIVGLAAQSGGVHAGIFQTNFWRSFRTRSFIAKWGYGGSPTAQSTSFRKIFFWANREIGSSLAAWSIGRNFLAF